MATNTTLSPSSDAAAPTSSPRSVAGTPRSSSSKRIRRQCSASDCSKVDAGGGFCVAHGGGKKCSFPGCQKGYQTGGFCRQHGGGSRCQVDGCGKVDAGKGLCRAHGGGKRCQVKSCSKADVGGGFCTAHGGGKRCSVAGCTKIDQGGGKCRAHGGARRCRHEECEQPARGSSGLCSDHGGAQICATHNCRRLVKREDTVYCSGCTKDRVQAEEVESYNDSNPTSFTGLLGHGMTVGYAEVEGHHQAGSTLDQFNAFIEAAEAVGASSHAYNSVLEEYDTTEVETRQPKDELEPSTGMASCLDNGCSKGFGGKCNCKAGCTCCSRAREAERSAKRQGIHATGSPPGHTKTASVVPSPPPETSYLSLPRISLHVQLRSGMPLEVVRVLVKAVGGVRSVHVVPTETDSDEEHRVTFVLRCDPGFEWQSIGSTLSACGLEYEFDDEHRSTIDWSYKEIVLKVEDMMCPGNCGRTVMNAMQNVKTVHIANLVFEDRCVIARGNMSAQDLCDAIETTGFDAVVVAQTPLPNRFRLRIQDFASVHQLGHRLHTLLMDVEGVESVLLMVDRAEILVEATLIDAGRLLEAANANRIMMVEVPEGVGLTQSSPFDPATETKEAESSDGEHVCDVKLCPQNGCEQYMATVAHTAALAVGWSVPGCAMSWGGECTCGENCKCVGCPQHNPLP